MNSGWLGWLWRKGLDLYNSLVRIGYLSNGLGWVKV